MPMLLYKVISPDQEIPGEGNCKNCHSLVQDNFCSVCGQSKKTGRITFRRVFEDVAEQMASLDLGLLRTIKDLTVRPGVMVRAYVLGKRKPYLKPLQFYLIMLTLYFVVNELLGVDAFKLGKLMGEQLGGAHRGDKASEAISNNITQALSENGKLIFSILTITLATSLRILYRKKNLYYVEMLVFALFIQGYSYFFSMLASVAIAIIGINKTAMVVSSSMSLLPALYGTWAIAGFFDQRGIKPVLKAVTAVVFSYLLYMLFSIFVAFLMGMFLFYKPRFV